MDELEASRASFAVETTLASRSLAPRLQRLRAAGYVVRVYYVWLPDAETAVNRVADRVRRGGHSIPEDVIRRRYERGLRNFLGVYRLLADELAGVCQYRAWQAARHRIRVSGRDLCGPRHRSLEQDHAANR